MNISNGNCMYNFYLTCLKAYAFVYTKKGWLFMIKKTMQNNDKFGI
jgi:hypothetical protein